MFYTRGEARAVSRVSMATLDRAIRAGELPVNRVGRRVLIAHADLLGWITGRPMGGAA